MRMYPTLTVFACGALALCGELRATTSTTGAAPVAGMAAVSSEQLQAAHIVSFLRSAADWQLANPHGETPITDWVAAPHYDGLLRFAQVSGDEKYLAAVIAYGRQAGWAAHYRKYHADDIAVGHAWLDVYAMDPSRRERFEPMKAKVDAILAEPRKEALNMSRPSEFPGVSATDRWTWCDALYMAPPTLVRLYSITGDKRYLEFMDSEFRFTYDNLWDPAEKLFYRDGNFPGKKSANGSKVFWGRGNGWVYGGLALVLEKLPKDWPTRPFYENLFKEMTEAVLAAQQPEGLWRPSLLDPKLVDIGETSASGFYVFGLAWGLNNGLLQGEAVKSAMRKGWAGLETRVRPDGYVGYVQRIGLAPDSVGPDSRQDYGTGALLLAGSELIRFLGAAKTPADQKAFVARAEAISESTEPRAYARLVPERKDDLAFENDRVAFRIYGPALRAGPEASGVDAWFKRTDKPVVDRWYRLDAAKVQSYHKDNGEGYDTFHVGSSLGCGGLGLWHKGKLVIAKTYTDPFVYDTPKDYAKFMVTYQYPDIEGQVITEQRTFVLRKAEQMVEITSVFRVKGGKLPALEVAAGLYTQGANPRFIEDAKAGVAAVWESIDGVDTGTGIAAAPAQIQSIRTEVHTDGHQQLLVLMKPDAKGKISWRAGFTWAKAGYITSSEAWMVYLKDRAERSSN